MNTVDYVLVLVTSRDQEHRVTVTLSKVSVRTLGLRGFTANEEKTQSKITT